MTSQPSEGHDVTKNHTDYMAAHELVVLGNKNHDASELQLGLTSLHAKISGRDRVKNGLNLHSQVKAEKSYTN